MENLISKYPICLNIMTIPFAEQNEDMIYKIISEVCIHILGIVLDDIEKLDFSNG
jgi:hypothetical protein